MHVRITLIWSYFTLEIILGNKKEFKSISAISKSDCQIFQY